MEQFSEREKEVAQEFLRRRLVRNSLTEWCRQCGFEPARHHKLLIQKLEKLARGEIRRLAIFMPPGSAKSTYASVLFPPWFLAQKPDAMVLCASHTDELAEKWGRRVRGLVLENNHVLGYGLSTDSTAAGRWATDQKGEYYAAGLNVGIAGFRADLAVIDDPVRSREDADSPRMREKAWEWYKADLIPRMKPGNRIMLIQTRWHEDDLAGRILAECEKGLEKWEVISLPAEAEENDPLGRKPGEFLWDDEYGYAEVLRHEKRSQPARNWSALYQQRPAPDSGDYFKEEWLRPCEKAPPLDTLNIYGASDYAVTSNGGDYTVHVVIGVDPDDNIYLLDVWRRQAASDVWVDAWCDLVRKWKPAFWAEETGQIKSGIGPFLEQRARERKAWTCREHFPTRGDKAVRAQSIRGRMAMCGLYVDVRAGWFADLRTELLSFPAGKHDDQVDALGLAGQLLDKFSAGQRRRAPVIEPKPAYVPAEAELMNDSFKTL